MKQLSIIAFFAIFLMAGWCSDASAQRWNMKAMIEKLDLSEKQVQEINQIFSEYNKSRRERRIDARKLHSELGNQLAGEELDKKAVDETVKKLVSAHSEMLEETVSLMIAIRKVLTPEQTKAIMTELPNMLSRPNFRRMGSRRLMNTGKVEVKEAQ